MDTAAIDLQHQFYDMLMQSQYWSPERMQNYQRGQLTHLLRHARKNVPFYENRLDAVFKANGEIDWDRWGEIPIVKRSDLVEHREAMQAKELPPGHGPVKAIESSGSTGQPVEVLVTRLAKLASDAARWRSGDWQGIDFSQRLCVRHGQDPENRPPTGKQGGSWGPPWDPVAQLGRTFMMDRGWKAIDHLHFMKRVSAPYLAIGVSKVAQVLAYEAERLDFEIRVPTIFVSGGKAGDDDREKCNEVFGARLIELYSSKEGGHLAHECPSGSGFHANSERALIELLDQEGLPVAASQPGRVVITPFFSTAQPLVRYDQGDLARWGHSCGCGRALPYIQSVDGRTSQMFRHPDGRRAFLGFPERYRHALKAGMWQFAQVGPTRFEIRYVPLDAEQHGDEQAVRIAFREWYFDDAEVSFRRLPAIPMTPGGKFMEYVYEADRSS